VNKLNLMTGTKRALTVLLTMGVLAFASMSTAGGNAGSGFVDKQYDVQGDWSLQQQGDNWVITLGDNFKTKSGPDLKIFLSPQSIDQVTGRTATKGSVLVSALQSNSGGQQYVLPSNINPADFKSLLIHCEAYSVLWGGANI